MQTEPPGYPSPKPIPIPKPSKVPLVIGLVALALAGATLGFVLEERYASSNCNATITPTTDGYVEDATCTYSDGLVCTVHVVVAGTSETQQTACK